MVVLPHNSLNKVTAMLLDSQFIKQAFPNKHPDMTGTLAAFGNPALEAKRQAALAYLGDKWLMHPNNRVQKKVKK